MIGAAQESWDYAGLVEAVFAMCSCSASAAFGAARCSEVLGMLGCELAVLCHNCQVRFRSKEGQVDGIASAVDGSNCTQILHDLDNRARFSKMAAVDRLESRK